MSERAQLLSLLIDEEVIGILKTRLSPEQRADLVLEIINPHRPLSTSEKASLAGVSERTVQRRGGGPSTS